ncbi:MAG: hypothetical protein ACLFTT_02915 [Candidatus Hydrogenedentota bacterium]
MRWARSALGVLLLSVAVAAAGEAMPPWVAVSGAASPTAATGNGRLTVSLDATGRLVGMQWPRPGLQDQLANPREGLAGTLAGAGWGLIGPDGGIVWLHNQTPVSQTCLEDALPMVQTNHRMPGGLQIEQTTFVHPAHALLVSHIAVSGNVAGGVPQLVFYTAPALCTRVLPEAPVRDWALDRLNHFAAFRDSTTATGYALRPAAPNARAYERARSLTAKQAPAPMWDDWGEGVWLGVTALGQGARARVVRADHVPEVWPEDRVTARMGPAALLVRTRGRLEQTVYAATIVMALGGNRNAVDNALGVGRKQDYSVLLTAARDHWYERMAAVNVHEPENRVLRNAALRALGVVLLSADAEGGGIVRAPSTIPPRAVVHPRDAGWLTLVLDRVGLHAEAGAHLRFLAKAFREEEGRGRPYGALPARLYVDSRPAAPHVLLDLDAVGWVLSACAFHARQLAPDEGEGFCEDIWPDVVRGADFLTHWTDHRTGAPLPAFQPGRLRDGESLATMLTVLLGLRAAEDIAERAGESPFPMWERRRLALEAALQLKFFQRSQPWTWPAGLDYWIEGALPSEYWLRSPLRLNDAPWTPLAVSLWPPPEMLAGFQEAGQPPPLDTRRAALFLREVLAAPTTPSSPAP